MGREAQCTAHVGAESASVKALLESTQLILRGPLRRRFDVAALSGVRAVAGQLRFQAGSERVALDLGEAESQRWAQKLTTPPPTLAAKLGIGPDQPAFVTGLPDDQALAAALAGATTSEPGSAAMLVAVVRSEQALQAAIEMHGRMVCQAVWIVHPKGAGAVPGDASVRQALRAAGYVDNKTTAVSAALTATRYARR